MPWAYIRLLVFLYLGGGGGGVYLGTRFCFISKLVGLYMGGLIFGGLR